MEFFRWWVDDYRHSPALGKAMVWTVLICALMSVPVFAYGVFQALAR